MFTEEEHSDQALKEFFLRSFPDWARIPWGLTFSSWILQKIWVRARKLSLLVFVLVSFSFLLHFVYLLCMWVMPLFLWRLSMYISLLCISRKKEGGIDLSWWCLVCFWNVFCNLRSLYNLYCFSFWSFSFCFHQILYIMKGYLVLFYLYI